MGARPARQWSGLETALRWTAPLLTLMVPAAATVAATPAGAALCGDGPLDILLTNDDGYRSAGIRALHAQLLAAGHRVVLAAPDHNASGSAMSFTWSPVQVTADPDTPGAFGVTGTPATAVVLAATALYPTGRRPDLVISGINHGPNAGALLALSGTVGAALAGTLLLDPPVPGMAVNAERLVPGEAPDSAANRAQFDAVAMHATQLLGAVRGWYCEDGRVALGRTVLNVNYPARATRELRGTVLAPQATSPDLRVAFVADPDGRYRAETARDAAAAEPGSDRDFLVRGFVTVTPVGGAIGDSAVPRRALERRLRELQPAARPASTPAPAGG
jgi:5'-nucleotidase